MAREKTDGVGQEGTVSMERGGGGKSAARVEHAVRERVADIARSAGLPSGQIAVQVLMLLPPDFLDAYEDLFHQALKLGDDGLSGEAREKGRVDADGQAATNLPVSSSRSRGARLREGMTLGGMAPAKQGGGKKGGGAWVVKDERALGRKQKVDKTLRKLAREMKLDQRRLDEGSGGAAIRCGKSGCGKFMEESWTFCPSCGSERKKGKKGEGRGEVE